MSQLLSVADEPATPDAAQVRRESDLRPRRVLLRLAPPRRHVRRRSPLRCRDDAAQPEPTRRVRRVGALPPNCHRRANLEAPARIWRQRAKKRALPPAVSTRTPEPHDQFSATAASLVTKVH